MAKFCTNCGHALDAGAAFCGNCGAPVAGAQQPQPQAQPQWQPQPQAQPQQPAGVWVPAGAQPPRQQARPTQPQWQQPAAPQRPAGNGWSAVPNGGAQAGIPAPGWSGRVNDPELRAALAKQKRASNRLSGFMIPIPLLGFAVYGMLSDNMEFSRALLYGAIVSAVFLVFSLIGKRQSSGKNAYEGVVVDKQTRSRQRRDDASSYTELITVVRTSTGAEKRITERGNSRTLAWEYLPVGAQFRYHPDHAFPYELYDKSRAPYLYCVVCQKKNPITADRCQKCGAPLLR